MDRIDRLIYINGKVYTEEELLPMINYYIKHVILPTTIPELNKDVLKEILLKSTPNTIKNMCLVNKNLYLIGNSKQFWIEKFNQLPLPQVLPLSIKDWVKINQKMLFNYNLANKLVKNIIKYKRFTRFGCLETHVVKMTWLPKKIVDAVKKYNKSSLTTANFNIKNNQFEISLTFVYGEHDDIIASMDKMEFIKYLTLLFYYHGKEKDFQLGEIFDDDTWEDAFVFTYNELTVKEYNYIKKLFPTW